MDAPSRCSDDQTCLAAGVGGRYICVDRKWPWLHSFCFFKLDHLDFLPTDLPEGAECSEALELIDDLRGSDLLDSVDARDKLDQLIGTVLPCRRGLVCHRESLIRRVCRAEMNG